jgi:hypothetical protein
MAERTRECGCTPVFQRPCPHMIYAVLKKETEHLTLDEVERTERFIQRRKGRPRREEMVRHLPLPYRIRVVRGGSPGSGKRG